MQSIANKTRASTFTGRARPSSRQAVVRCVASQASRRDALLAGLALASSPMIFAESALAEGPKYNVRYLPVDKLGSFQKADQRKEFVDRAGDTVMQFLSASDAPACIRLALQDAGTYDIATKTGGATGAAALNPSSSLAPLVEKLRKAKQAIDEGDKTGAGPISWADLIYVAGKATTQASWREVKMATGGEKAALQASNPWPAVMGRLDSDVSGPNKVPAADASVEEITNYLLALGAKPSSGPFAPKAPFWQKPGFLLWTASAADPAAEEQRFAAYSQQYADIKRSYDISRDTISRTDYEMDFAAVYNKLTSLGAQINPTAYLYPQPILAAKL